MVVQSSEVVIASPPAAGDHVAPESMAEVHGRADVDKADLPLPQITPVAGAKWWDDIACLPILDFRTSLTSPVSVHHGERWKVFPVPPGRRSLPDGDVFGGGRPA